ncbi:ankyrin repeat domain-containing protein [Endozoicomonas sp. 4G]|uniref:ankyrin repeat domain-containing protein n=1 Tax=Endozoicomonas sp. 4G TaxID=2872754 RepID=UPI0020785784|nr:ankyrin repeat domain-containing protein [Endozoicomonas sp. 4G]
MKTLLYSDLQPEKIKGLPKTLKALEEDDFVRADVRKVDHNLYRARLNKSDRLLFSLYSYEGSTYCLVLEHIRNHAYEKSRFLSRGAEIDEEKIPTVASSEALTIEPLPYLNNNSSQFNLLDKIISFDTSQKEIYQMPAPLVIIGSAGSGKTALTLEKMKQAAGDVLYISLSSFLVQNSRNLYYAKGYENEYQEVDFLSLKEFLESLQVPAGKEVSLKDFENWFRRQKSPLRDPHKVFEEFRGVLTSSFSEAWLSRDDYRQLGVKQSIFNEEERASVYDLFERYLAWMEKEGFYDSNIVSYQYQSLAKPQYDFIVIDEVQDITNVQLYLILKTLRNAGQFLLCGDSNQIVHPNFFSWDKVKSLFFNEQKLSGGSEIIRVLQTNYRNSAVVTAIANRILKLKQARFGSIDKESNYLVQSIGGKDGTLQVLKDTDAVKRDLNAKTALSTRFAVLVMHPEQKPLASRWFKTPLVFSVQEAKGLEYDNIILFNFVQDEEKAFREIAAGIDPKQLEGDSLNYARSKDKRDKSLEVYKFYINALYVAMTRAVNNLYLIEGNLKHPLLKLLDLENFSGELTLDKQDSSLEDWQKEAHKLELQGKQDQADDIRSRILQEKPVPWPVYDREAFTKLCEQGFEGSGNKKKRILALEYAMLYHHQPTLNALQEQNFRAAFGDEGKSLSQLYRKHYMLYTLKNPGGVLRDTEKYGINHRTIFNLTPLMVAAKTGNTELVDTLIERGAEASLTGSNGLNALQMALETATVDPTYSSKKLPSIYERLQPDTMAIQAEGRLIKLDKKLMGLFLFNLMCALFYRKLGDRLPRWEGFTAQDLTTLVQELPDSVLPERRKKQTYISGILSTNEVDRDHRYNRKLFKRIRRGHYILNPNLKLRFTIKQEETWVGIYDLLQLDDLDVNYTAMLGGDQEHQKLMREFYQQRFGSRLKESVAGIKAMVESGPSVID